jgi:hypothetical protein
MLREVSRASVLPVVQPIQPVLTKPFHRDGWVYEEKHGGWRTVAYEGWPPRQPRQPPWRGSHRALRRHRDCRPLPSSRTLILDGKVSSSMNPSSPTCTCSWDPPTNAVVTPPVFIAFDIYGP